MYFVPVYRSCGVNAERDEWIQPVREYPTRVWQPVAPIWSLYRVSLSIIWPNIVSLPWLCIIHHVPVWFCNVLCFEFGKYISFWEDFPQCQDERVSYVQPTRWSSPVHRPITHQVLLSGRSFGSGSPLSACREKCGLTLWGRVKGGVTMLLSTHNLSVPWRCSHDRSGGLGRR